MSEGKKGTAPCGHPGTHVVGNYVQCDIGCDRSGVPKRVEPETTEPLFVAVKVCPHCRSYNTDRQVGVVWKCMTCGWYFN